MTYSRLLTLPTQYSTFTLFYDILHYFQYVTVNYLRYLSNGMQRNCMLYNKIRLLMLLFIVWTTPIPQTDLWQKAISIYFDYRVELIKCILSYALEWPDESVSLYHRIFPVTLTNSFSFQNLFSEQYECIFVLVINLLKQAASLERFCFLSLILFLK